MVFWGFLEMLDLTTLKPGPYSIAWHTVISVLAFLCRLRFAAFVNNRLDPAGSGSLLWMRGFSVGTCCFAAVGTSCCLLACVYVNSLLLPSKAGSLSSCSVLQLPDFLSSFITPFWVCTDLSAPTSIVLLANYSILTLCSVFTIFSLFFIVEMFVWHLCLYWYNMGRGENCLCVPSWAILLLAPTSCLSSWDWSRYAASGRRMVLSCTLQFLVTAVTGIAG